jgi:hypothetical protein
MASDMSHEEGVEAPYLMYPAGEARYISLRVETIHGPRGDRYMT